MARGGVAPAQGGVLVARPADARGGRGPAIDALPRRLGQAGLLFGRQTDREARFEIVASADELPQVERIVRETAGENVDGEPRRELLGESSTSHKVITPMYCLPPGVAGDRARAPVAESVRDGFLNRWPELRLCAGLPIGA